MEITKTTQDFVDRHGLYIFKSNSKPSLVHGITDYKREVLITQWDQGFKLIPLQSQTEVTLDVYQDLEEAAIAAGFSNFSQKTIYNIQPGDEYYVINFNNDIIKYEYLCRFPSRNPKYTTPENYHIVINKKSEMPERIYYTELTRHLERGYSHSYEDAKREVRKRLENKLKELLNDFDEFY